MFGVPLLHLIQNDRGENPKYNTPVILEQVSMAKLRYCVLDRIGLNPWAKSLLYIYYIYEQNLFNPFLVDDCILGK